MAIPTLPQELWARIVHLLPPSSLSSISQVNRALHKISTTTALFSHHVNHNSLPTATPPQQQFRRLRALSHPPPTHTSTKLSSSLRILLAIDDTLLLHDVSSSRIVAFPTGFTIDVVRLVGDPPVTHEGLLARSVVLPGNNIAFVSCINRVRLAIWNFITGDLLINQLAGGLRAFCKPIVDDRFAVVAGENAEWILYYARDNNVVVADWASGRLVKELTPASTFDSMRFVMAECAAVHEMSVMGVVSQRVNGSVVEIICKCFDGVETTFRTVKPCSVVLRSLDKRTHVVILSPSRIRGSADFFAQRKHAGVINTWNGALPFCTRPELRGNGRVITATRGLPKCFYGSSHFADDSLFWVELTDGGGIERMDMRKRDGNQPVWLLRTAQGAFAVMVRERAGVVEFIKFVKERGMYKDIRVKSWSIKEKIVDAAVVGDHRIVATCQHGRLFLWHFDKFCGGAKDVYVCPGLIPKQFAVTRTDGREVRR